MVDDNCRQFARKTFMPTDQAMKQVKKDELVKRFRREVKCQKSLSHPNIVPIVADFLDDDPPSFIMPLANYTLRDELYSRQPTKENITKILFDILSGLEFLHNQGFVHRDLKPANILKFDDGTQSYYALSDFGFVSGVNSETSTLTATNAGGGTENYSAPELIRGFRTATAQADIYSFGAILHDIFAKNMPRIPYTELTLASPIGAIIEKCTKLQPRRRYQNVADLREDLYQVLRSNEIVFTSSNEEKIVNLLKENEKLTDEQWDSVFLQIDDNLDKGQENDNIIANLSLAHIENLQQNSPELFHAMGRYFAESIMGKRFSFEYCDILANKAEKFYADANLELKAVLTLALLDLGTRHNRFYVEKKTKTMLDRQISPELANRIKIEVDLLDFDFNSAIEHLVTSIGLNQSFLHKDLQDI